ncbi:MAG: cation diffusion facilitator family transporter [Proteobacteria bacterium]|nr:cation diffusion facilitator family transporter [Pseudomonadota bacterium]MBU1234759.1 cation diffusion facilitator family transporter [Pseudomonadota bacterium]MBU1420661.1 cation diffusion facilitator family transporter [Pseudomonadota bacterium]MBU1454313.1 cation diffusion facilitator family transporter [Pseudomonadota bacterium]
MIHKQSQEKLAAARKQAAISISLNLFLALSKGIAGVLSGSAALLGDAIHSATDVFASTAVFVGIWVAGREHPAFPYGLYKAETVAALIASIAVILAGYEIGRQALFGVSGLPDIVIALPVAAISFLIALGFGIFQLRAGKKLDSPALIADARDYLADSLSTAVVLVGLLVVPLGFNVDRLAAGIVSLFVFYAGGQLFVGSLKDLLDASIDRDTERGIIAFVEGHPRIVRVNKCFSRNAGGRYLVDMDVVMHTPSHKMADQVADRLEEELLHHFPGLILARIRPHYAPGQFIRRVTPVQKPEGQVSLHLASAPWFLIETMVTETREVKRRQFVENRYKDAKKRKGLLVGRWLLKLKPDEVVAEDKESVAVILLKEAGVDMLQPSSLTSTMI